MRKLLVAVVAALIFPLIVPVSTLAAPTTRTVCSDSCDFTTIQAAIDASAYGDIVQVFAGIYNENIVLADGVTVQGDGADDTIIQGDGTESVVAAFDVDSNTRIEGFTITGGHAPNYGGGIYISSSSLTITNNIIRGNIAGTYGGGIFINGSGVASFTAPVITNNFIIRNDAGEAGDGIYIKELHNSIITNNTIAWNSSYGVQCNPYPYTPTSCATIINSIIWYHGTDLSTNIAPSYSDYQSGGPASGGDHNIHVVPSFVNADDNNFHLLAASPCVNVGDNTAAVSAGLTTDFDGQDRIIGGIVDMGADEVSDFTGPITSNVAVSTNPAPIGTLVNITATVDDFTTGESLIATAEYNVDGGAWVPMSAADGSWDAPSENVIEPLVTTIPSLFEVCVRGTDAEGNIGATTCTDLVVYDPTAGYVTGRGQFDSPAGAYTDNTDLTGTASFAFVSKFRRGASVPTGKTEFHFATADLDFRSSTYEWMVVTGKNYAMFKGEGTINGGGNYKFMIWAGDNDPSTDTFRIRIWEEIGATEDVIYDNGSEQAITKGRIEVHAK